MTEKVLSNPAPVAQKEDAATAAPKKLDKYPAMQFVVQFSHLASTVIAVFFLLMAVISIFTGLFSEDASIVWGFVNAGFSLLVGAVLIGLVRGMGEAFEVLLELEKRK